MAQAAKKSSEKDSLIRTRLFSGGAWTDSKSGKTFDVKNPATGDVIAAVADADIADVNAAIDSANAAFTAWKSALPEDRAKILKRWNDLVLDHADALADELALLRQAVHQLDGLQEARAGAIEAALLVRQQARPEHRAQVENTMQMLGVEPLARMP